MQTFPDPHVLLEAVRQARNAFLRNEASESDVYAAANAYLDELKRRKKADPKRYKKLNIPTIPNLLRNV